MGWADGISKNELAIVALLFLVMLVATPYLVWWSLRVLGWTASGFSLETWVAVLVLLYMIVFSINFKRS